MSQHDCPKPGANVTLIASDGQRVHGQFISTLGADWNIAFKATDLDWLYSVEQVEINFIMNYQVCNAKAELGAIDAGAGRCMLLNIHELKSRPLRGQERVDVSLNCAMILRDDSGKSSDYINSRQNSVSNISRTGAMLSTNRELDASRGILLLFALDGHPDLEPPDHRMFVPGKIVREVNVDKSAFSYHYGIQFSNLPPDFFEMLSSYVEYLKVVNANKGRAA